MDIDNIQSENFRLQRKDGSGDYLFVLFKSPAYVFANGVYYEVGMGNAILFNQSGVQDYFPVNGRKFIHDFLHFEPETEAEKALIADIPMDTVLHIALPQLISDVLRTIKAELYYRHSFQTEILSTLGMLFLYRIKSELTQDARILKKRALYERFHRLKEAVYNAPEKAWSVESAAKEVLLSESYFKHMYPELMGVAFMQDVISARLLKAKILLQRTDVSISEIASSCGYAGVEHFIRQFRKHMGLSPKQFRSL